MAAFRSSSEITFASGASRFRKGTGKKSDYWIFVQEEGKKMFLREHNRRFCKSSEDDQRQMGDIWQNLPSERRQYYKRKAEEENDPAKVRERRQVEALRTRTAHQNAGDEGFYHRMTKIQQQDEQIAHRLATEASNEGDLNVFSDKELLFYYGSAAIIHRTEVRSYIEAQLTIQHVGKKDDVLKSALRSQNFAIIKANVFDSVYVSDRYKARTHPSEFSLVVFGMSSGIMKTRHIPIRFCPQLLYGSKVDGIPEQHYDAVMREQNITDIKPNEQRSRELSVTEAFSAIFLFIEEQGSINVCVQADDWNHIVGSLFFLAHSSGMVQSFKKLMKRLTIFEEEIAARENYWNKQTRGKGAFEPANSDEIAKFLYTPRAMADPNSQYYCEHHLKKHEKFKVNCSLSRAAAVVHNAFAYWTTSRFTDWMAAPGSTRFSFAVDLPPGLVVAHPENSITHVVKMVAEAEIRDLDAPPPQIESSDDEDFDDLPHALLHKNLDAICPQRSMVSQLAYGNMRRGYEENIPPRKPDPAAASPVRGSSSRSLAERFGAPSIARSDRGTQEYERFDERREYQYPDEPPRSRVDYRDDYESARGARRYEEDHHSDGHRESRPPYEFPSRISPPHSEGAMARLPPHMMPAPVRTIRHMDPPHYQSHPAPHQILRDRDPAAAVPERRCSPITRFKIDFASVSEAKFANVMFEKRKVLFVNEPLARHPALPRNRLSNKARLYNSTVEGLFKRFE